MESHWYRMSHQHLNHVCVATLLWNYLTSSFLRLRFCSIPPLQQSSISLPVAAQCTHDALRGNGEHLLEASNFKLDMRRVTSRRLTPDVVSMAATWSRTIRRTTSRRVWWFLSAPFHNHVIISFCDGGKHWTLKVSVKLTESTSGFSMPSCKRLLRTGSMNASISCIFPSVSNWSLLARL